MKIYKVNWAIEVLADSSREAAEQALRCIVDGDAHVFEVQEVDIPNNQTKKEPVEIDLNEAE